MLSLSFKCLSVLILFWGVACAQLAGTEPSFADISEKLSRSRREFAPEILSSNNVFSRLLRNTRQRNGGQGRTFNFRSSGCCGGAEHICCCAAPLFSSAGSSGEDFRFVKDNNFWTEFIISAFPVRAGPFAA